MPARATRKAETAAASAAPGVRRSGRPRAATASSRIYSDLRSRVGVAAATSRRGDLGSRNRAVLRRQPDAGARGDPEIVRRRVAGDISAIGHLRLAAFRSRHCRKPSSFARRSRRPPHNSPPSARPPARSWCCMRSWNASARPMPPTTGTPSIRPMRSFHATIAEVAGHPGIWTLIQQVKVHVDRYRRLTLPQQGRIARVIEEHEAILDAIEAHDPAPRQDRHGNPSRTAARRHSATQSINPEFFDQQGPLQRAKLTSEDAAANESRAIGRI